MKKLIIAVFLLVLVLALVLVGCGGGQGATATSKTTTKTSGAVTTATTAKTSTSPSITTGGTLKVADYTLSVNVGYPQGITSGYIKRDAAPGVENLVHVDSQGVIQPWLATSWVQDPAAATITLTLRNDVKFHDGTDFNADAVKWNLDEAVTAKQMASTLVKSVDVIDPTHVRINMVSWNNGLIDSLGSSFIGMMISPTTFKANGGKNWAANNPVGTGPFKFKSFEPSVQLAWEKNTNYWQKGLPYLDGITKYMIADRTVSDLAFKRGEYDVVLYALPENVGDYRTKGYQVQALIGGLATPHGCVFDAVTSTSPFSKLEVRQACQYAIDTNAMNQGILYGTGEAAKEMTYSQSWAYNTDVVGYPYNLEKAKQLMVTAGYEKGFECPISYSASPENDTYAAAVAGYLSKINITLKVTSLPSPQFTTLCTSTNYTGMLYLSPPPYDDIAAGLFERYIGLKGQRNKLMGDFPDYIDLVNKAVTATKFEDKQNFTRQAIKLLTDKYCASNMWFFTHDAAVSQKYVHDTGLFATVGSNNMWTPYTAWMDKH